jgi:NAD(P)-dependent dehydrogenase (short-subunit alcohol dehydrogenase family)
MGKSHHDRVAVITGAASGIGRAFALRLAQEGCHVAIADLKPADDVVAAITALDRMAYSECCDLADADAIARFGANVLQRFGRVDILVNNAAYIPLNLLENLQLAEFRKVMAVNVEAALLLSQLFVPGMKERHYGRIVNLISSTTSTPMPSFLSYTTSKMASVGLVRALAAALGADGITVNGLSPGLTLTEASAKELPQVLFDAVRERQLIKRTGVPDDMCGALTFLTSEDAGFITGQRLNVDGGVVF